MTNRRKGLADWRDWKRKSSYPSQAKTRACTAQWAALLLIRMLSHSQTPLHEHHRSTPAERRLPILDGLSVHPGDSLGRESLLWSLAAMYPFSCTTLLLSYGLLLHHQAHSADCNADEVGVAIISCQNEREMLSQASQMNNNTQLCQALQKYSECIEPKISGCTGEALVAFRVIKQKYTADPYNCHVEDYTDNGDGGNTEDNYLDTRNDDTNSHDNKIMPSTQNEGFAGVTVAGLPDDGNSQDSVASKRPPPNTDAGDDEADVNSSSNYANTSSFILMLTLMCTLKFMLY